MKNKVKFLFLDDDKERIGFVTKEFASIDFVDIYIAETADQAIRLLTAEKFDMISLDHDLGGEVYQDSAKGTGFEVAVALSKIDFYIKNDIPICVHSWNPDGAKNMINILNGRAVREPFSEDVVKSLIAVCRSIYYGAH